MYEAPFPPMTPNPSSTPYTLYTRILYTYSHRGGEEGELTREKVRGATVNKAGSKIPIWLTASFTSLQTLINTCFKVPVHSVQVNFFRWHLALVSIQFCFLSSLQLFNPWWSHTYWSWWAREGGRECQSTRASPSPPVSWPRPPSPAAPSAAYYAAARCSTCPHRRRSQSVEYKVKGGFFYSTLKPSAAPQIPLCQRMLELNREIHIYEYHIVCPLVGTGTLPTPSLASECAFRPDQEGRHTRLRLRRWGSPNSDDWTKSLALCLLGEKNHQCFSVP